jgi:Family of unknown function (DUF6232)
MGEKSFFNEGGVSVSNARFIVRGQTYAMSGVTSVKAFRQDPSSAGPLIVGIIGILLVLADGGTGGTATVIGLALIAGSVAILPWPPSFLVALIFVSQTVFTLIPNYMGRLSSCTAKANISLKRG